MMRGFSALVPSLSVISVLVAMGSCKDQASQNSPGVTGVPSAGGGTSLGGTSANAGTPGSGGVTPTVPGTGGVTASTGGATASAGGATADAGGVTASTGGATASTGGATASTGGAAMVPGKLGVTPTAKVKPRVIATTDGEIDDRSSMVRFLTYASDYNVAGIVQVNSNAQRSGHSDEKWIEKQIAAYESHLPNLRVHRPDYPDASQLLSVLKVGNENSGDYGKDPSTIADSEGAQHIIKVLLDDDPRPVHILAWGGANTQANAFAQLKAKYTPEEYNKAVSKAVLYCIWFQDAAGSYIVNNHPGVKIYGAGVDDRDLKNDNSWRDVWDYRSVDGKKGGNRASANPPAIQTLMADPWMTTNIKTNHGALGVLYPQSYTSEGDTPSFLPLLDNGLEQHVDYRLGGWGGRPIDAKGNFMQDGADDNAGTPDMHYTFWRWVTAAQNDWAARSDWFVAEKYADANHQPDARILGDLVRVAAAGSTVNLDASPTTDPDGDAMTFRWWQYHEADSAAAKITITTPDAQTGASFVVPPEPGKEVHVILEVVDQGTPPLTRYQRMVVQIQ